MQQTFQATGDDVQEFAELTGDDNEIHVDPDAASESIFGERVAHGVLGLSWVSSMLSEYGEETTVLLGFNDVEYHNPIYLGEEIQIKVWESRCGEDKTTMHFEARYVGGFNKFEGTADVMFVEDDNE